MNLMTSKKWWQSGSRPDYRFSLANERTFLAWIRTALALIAGAVGIDQFALHLGSPVFRCVVAIAILIAGGVAGGMAYRRWAATESAMRNDADVPATGMLPGLSFFVAILAAIIGFIVLAS